MMPSIAMTLQYTLSGVLRRRGRHVRGVRPVMETLEARCLLSAVYPTAVEQYMVELINRARSDPAGTAASFGIDLNEGLAPGTISASPKQPVAINPYLTDAALGHSQWMLDSNLFQHEGPGTAQPGDRMAWAGYTFAVPYSWGENLAWRGNTVSYPNLTEAVRQMDQDLFVDAGIEDRGHRVNTLTASYTEVGVGVLTGIFRQGGRQYRSVMATQDFASTAGNRFLTGVAYNDSLVVDNFYTPGEGLGGVTITAVRQSDQAVFTTQTWDAGGYSLQLPPGTYRVGASGGGLEGMVGYNSVTIGGQNVKRDFTRSTPANDVLAPTASFETPPPIQYGGQAGYDLVVHYQDNRGINLAGIDDNDIRITGPNGFEAMGTLLNLSGSDNGTQLKVIYRITAPNGAWTLHDNGTYQVSLLHNAVSDTAGNYVPSGLLGSFSVDIGPTVGSGIETGDDSLPLLTSSTIITGSDAGGLPVVQGFNPDNDTRRFRMLVFEEGYTGGVRVATGDVNGDGTPDLIVASGGDHTAEVRVFNGITGKQLPGPVGDIFPYGGYRGGIRVASGDVNGDGYADIITSVDAAPGIGPHVAVFSGADGSMLWSFWAYDARFDGGVNIAAGDVNGDGYADIIAGPASSAGPNVVVYSGRDNHLLQSYWAYDPHYDGGIDVASGDINGDGRADVITSAMVVSHVAVFSGTDQTLLASFFAYPGFTGQTRLGAADVDGDGRVDLLTGAGPRAGPHVKAFSSANQFTLVESFFADDPAEDPYGLYIA